MTSDPAADIHTLADFYERMGVLTRLALACLYLPIGLAFACVIDKDIAMRPLCWITGHRFADEYTYGVEPECLDCGARR